MVTAKSVSSTQGLAPDNSNSTGITGLLANSTANAVFIIHPCFAILNSKEGIWAHYHALIAAGTFFQIIFTANLC